MMLRAVYQLYGTPRDLVDEILKTPPAEMLPKKARELLRAGVVHAIEDLHPDSPEGPTVRPGGRRNGSGRGDTGTGRAARG